MPWGFFFIVRVCGEVYSREHQGTPLPVAGMYLGRGGACSSRKQTVIVWDNGRFVNRPYKQKAPPYRSQERWTPPLCKGRWRAKRDGGIVKISLVSKQSLSPLSLATFDSASRQRRSRRRLAAFTSTQGRRKTSRPLASSQNCEKTVREKSKPRRDRRSRRSAKTPQGSTLHICGVFCI